MSYIGTEPKDIRSFGRTKFDYTATQGQTAFTGADDDGKVLAFTTGQIEVYVNGILMDDSDFSTTGTGTVTLASAANLNDVVNVVSFETNIPDSNYVPASGGTFTGNITASGTLGVTGAVTASNGLTVDDAGATPLTVDRATNDGTIIDVQKDGTSVGSIKTDNGKLVVNSQGSNLVFAVGGTSKANMDGTQFYPQTDGGLNLSHPSVRWQDLYLSGGAYLGGTGAANKLEDYEEGSFTPVLYGGTTAGTASVGNNYGFYTKVGNVVHVEVRIQNITLSGAGGQLSISGLPFATRTSHSYSVATPMMYNFAFTANNKSHIYTSANDTVLRGLESQPGTGWTLWSITNSNGLYMNFSLSYGIS